MNKLIIFLAGVATGTLASWKFMENKYSKIANEEIESVMERFSNIENMETDIETDSEENLILSDDDNDNSNDDNEINKEYVIDTHIDEYDNIYDLNDVEEDESYAAPYIISDDEFAENDDYEIVTFIYYDDNMLADEDDELVVDPENLVGDTLTHFIYNKLEDSIYVRNEKTKCDYEILRSEKKYSELIDDKMEDK